MRLSEDDSDFSWPAQLVLRAFIVKPASSGGSVHIPWQTWHFVRCDEIDRNLARDKDFQV